MRVLQTADGLVVSPAAATLPVGSTQAFAATLLDQFGTPMASQPGSFTWSVNSGGTIDSAGVFSATSAGGPYLVTASSGEFSNIASVTVTPAAATITLSNLEQTYDGSPKPVTVTTDPPGLAVDVTYAGSSTVPTNASSYAVEATISDPNYQGSASATLIIDKATATIILGNLTQTYDGSPKPISATTTPEGLAVDITYNALPDAPIEVGTYSIVVTVNDPNHQGSASSTLVIEAGNDIVSWKNEHFSEAEQTAGLAAEDADPDFDGLPNLAEFALGADPREFTPPLVPTLDETGLSLIFNRPANLTGVTYGAESTDELGIWSPIPLEVIQEGDPETVRARDPLTTGDPSKRFLRLRFESP